MKKRKIQLLTAEETVTALECCLSDDIEACERCPIDEVIKDECDCCRHMAANALNLIRELTSDNEEMKRRIDNG